MHAFFYIYYHSISQLTGFPIRAFESVGPFHFMPLDRHVQLHLWVIYRQLAEGNSRFRVAFLKIMNKGYREADFSPQKKVWNDPRNEFGDFNHCLLRRCHKMGHVLDWVGWELLKPTASPAGGESSLTVSLHPCAPRPADLLPCILGNCWLLIKRSPSGTWTSATRKYPGWNFLRNTSLC